jgi:hypothetical protein
MHLGLLGSVRAATSSQSAPCSAFDVWRTNGMKTYEFILPHTQPASIRMQACDALAQVRATVWGRPGFC